METITIIIDGKIVKGDLGYCPYMHNAICIGSPTNGRCSSCEVIQKEED